MVPSTKGAGTVKSRFSKNGSFFGYQVTRQARHSSALRRLINWGIAPPYRKPVEARLSILGSEGTPLYELARRNLRFESYEEIPPLLLKSLLFMENRGIEDPPHARSNPAIEWPRLLKASLSYVAHRAGLGAPLQGGSTLAVQMEKYQHSSRGKTDSVGDKIRQIVSASLKVYRDGPETKHKTREIILDYVNTVPLAAAPGYGEVHGLGEGLDVWFGLSLDEVEDALNTPQSTPSKIRVYKHVLALLAALTAPSRYLLDDRAGLLKRANTYVDLLAEAKVLESDFARAVKAEPVRFLTAPPATEPPTVAGSKAGNAVRRVVAGLLNISNTYDLNRLDLEVESTIATRLQRNVTAFFDDLVHSEFARTHGLMQERLLQGSDLRKVVYSLMLFERTAEGNMLRVQADNLKQQFDLNQGGKLELGSTAKLRTLAHYLEVVALLYREASTTGLEAVAAENDREPDPITRWALETLRRNQGIPLDVFLERALERTYSASPHETFFTGGGLHRFDNFDAKDDARVVTLREAMQQSINLPFIRLMRDLVSYHRVRLPYDAKELLSRADHPMRQRLLEEIAEEEATAALSQAYRKYRGLSHGAIVERLLRHQTASPRHLAILFFAWDRGDGPDALAVWLSEFLGNVSREQAMRLWRAYSNDRLNMADYGYLLSRNPLEVWLAGKVWDTPNVSWNDVLAQSSSVRAQASAWLFRAKNRRAQDLRLRNRIERDAFALMTPYWQRLRFPFETLVPSYATAIGSSSDRPVALAELVGIIVNGGLWRPTIALRRLRFAAGTPYETLFEPRPDPGARVMEPAVAGALRTVLSEVVDAGTARRVKGAFVRSDGTSVDIGGKTGSGDNRVERFNRAGAVTSSRVVNRTATFVFFISDRYFGVVTASVHGGAAAQYHFTSALPVTLVKLLAPVISESLAVSESRDGERPPNLSSGRSDSAEASVASEPAAAHPVRQSEANAYPLMR